MVNRQRGREQDRTGDTSQENDVDPGRYLSFASRSTAEIASSPHRFTLIFVCPLPALYIRT